VTGTTGPAVDGRLPGSDQSGQVQANSLQLSLLDDCGSVQFGNAAEVSCLPAFFQSLPTLKVRFFMSETIPAPRPRLASLDQFRGYTVAGMLLVNFLGGYAICPRILQHTNDFCSYADTIMPQFLFAAGFAMQLGAARLALADRATRWKRIARRFIGLSLVAIIWYSFGDWDGIWPQLQSEGLMATLAVVTKRTWFQTLLHISVTSLWITPVVGRSIPIRVAWAAGSGLLHIWLSWWFNFDWVNGANGGHSGIDGGPLGFLTWSVTAITGTVACDIVRSGASGIVRRLVIWGVLIAGVAYGLSSLTTLYNIPVREPQGAALPEWYGPTDSKLAIDPVVPSPQRLQSVQWTWPEPPFVAPPGKEVRQWNYWMMSQRAGTLTYCLFAAGISLIVLAFFYWFSDVCGQQVGVFRTFGTNALAAYIFHDIAGWIIDPFVTRDSPATEVLLAFAAFFCLVYGACRILEWKKWYVRM